MNWQRLCLRLGSKTPLAMPAGLRFLPLFPTLLTVAARLPGHARSSVIVFPASLKFVVKFCSRPPRHFTLNYLFKCQVGYPPEVSSVTIW